MNICLIKNILVLILFESELSLQLNTNQDERNIAQYP
jgi:hypothetical protein